MTESEKNLFEWQAHWFALAFLMPEKEFLRIYKESGEDIELTGDCFRVPKDIAELRLKVIK